MKKEWCIVLSLLLCLGMLVACRPQAENSGEETSGSDETDRMPMQDPSMPTDNVFHPETDYQYSWGKNGDYFQRTPDGLYFWGLGRLYFLDESTLMPQICCFRPDCEHHWYEYTCTADLSGVFQGIEYMDGRLYYDAVRGIGGKYQSQFYSVDYTGDNCKKLMDYPEYANWIIHRGYLYSYYRVYEENAHSQEGKIMLTQTSLKDPNMTKTLWEGGWSNLRAGDVTAYGNYLIFSRLRESATADYIDLYSLNLQTGELKQFTPPEGVLPQSFRQDGDRILVKTVKDMKTQCFFSLSLSLEDSIEYTEWEEENINEKKIYIGADTQYIYKGVYDQANGKHENLEIMDRNGTVVDTVDLSSLDEKIKFAPLALYCDPKEDGYVFLANAGLNWGFYYFKKSEIGSGEIQVTPMMPVCSTYEYEKPEDIDLEKWPD